MTEIEARRPESVAQQDAHLQWGAVGMLVAMSSAGAFLVGWHFARRWIRFIGW